ncbi:MAG: MGDG synthase family glycosyltransferase [Omnitrophica WOR_2 bacterium]
MSVQINNRPQILILFSDTGGGHRSAAEAIVEAIRSDYGNSFSIAMVDFFKEYAPPPLNRMPAWYPSMMRMGTAWGWSYRLSNGHRRGRIIISTFWPYVRRAVKRLVMQNTSDLIISVHPLANAPVLQALGENRPPFITVVTDLISTHALWYHRHVDVCFVPTQTAYDRAILNGLKPEQVRLVGLPVAERFCQSGGDRVSIRNRLGWPQDLPVVLLVGGGEGMGPLERTALAIAQSGLPVTLVVVTGRNQSLKARLESYRWPHPTFIYGFVREMPDFMRAADILVTKAGPGTITEAFNASLPIILYSRLAGQEDGNVSYVVKEGAGLWAPTPNQIVTAVSNWVYHPEKRQNAADASRRLSRPYAAHEIASVAASLVEVKVPR